MIEDCHTKYHPCVHGSCNSVVLTYWWFCTVVPESAAIYAVLKFVHVFFPGFAGHYFHFTVLNGILFSHFFIFFFVFHLSCLIFHERWEYLAA
jgi:hypothetical protein